MRASISWAVISILRGLSLFIGFLLVGVLGSRDRHQSPQLALGRDPALFNQLLDHQGLSDHLRDDLLVAFLQGSGFSSLDQGSNLLHGYKTLFFHPLTSQSFALKPRHSG